MTGASQLPVGSAASRPAGIRFRNRAAAGLICLAAVLAYLPALRGGFIWDDDAHVTKPALRSLAGLARIWFDLGATQQYYPVLHSAFWLEHRLWGDTAWCYHLLNVGLHALAACLFAAVLRRLKVPGSTLAGLLFALHPVCVESVAWISEQKNTLSTVFYLLSALAYLRWRQGKDGEPASGYGWAAVFFLLALLTKTVTATLPAALLLVGWWRRGRLSWRQDVRPLILWFAAGAAAGVLTAWVERRYIGASGAAFDLSPLERCLLAGRVVWFYLGKLLWPARLVFIYPRWRLSAADPLQWLPLAGTVALTLLLLRESRSRTDPFRRAALCAWLFFAGSLFPALGFVNVYPFIFSYVADHFQYLAILGPIALASAGAALAVARLGPAARAWLGAAVAGVLIACALRTSAQCRTYRDAPTLYQRTLELNPACWLAHLNLGNIVLAEGDRAGALAHYRTAEGLEPDYPSIHFNLGRVLLAEGDPEEARAEFAADVRLVPSDAEAHNNLGVALGSLGRLAEARAEFERAIALRPDYAVARANLARAEAGAPP